MCRDLNAVSTDVKAMVRQRRTLRFLRARQHSAQLVQLLKRLDWADQSFTVSILSFNVNRVALSSTYLQRTMLSSVDMKASEILETVLPLRDEVHRLTRIGRYFF